MKRNIIVFAVIGFIFSLSLPVFASVSFDGLTWYHSRDPNRLILNDDHHLVWVNPKGPDMVTVYLPEMKLTAVGDKAEIIYMFKADGVETGKIGTDPTILSGTGDLRIGLFDSNGGQKIISDNTGYAGKYWCGYLGYCIRACPHLTAGIKRHHSDAIPGKIMKRVGAFDPGKCGSLISSGGTYNKGMDLSGFDVPLGEFTKMILCIERTSAGTMAVSITFNNITYTYVDENAENQPDKIDTLALYFPNPKSITSITFAGCHFSCSPADKTK